MSAGRKGLIVINGPIGAGKSTVAQALADDYRRRGTGAAVIDLDIIYLMLDGVISRASESAWLGARRGAAALTNEFLSSGTEVVIVEGPFWNREERSPFVDALTGDVKPLFVTLLVSYDEALRRVEGDVSRGVSRDPEFLKRVHGEFHSSFEQYEMGDIIIDSSDRTPHEVAEVIAREVGLPAMG